LAFSAGGDGGRRSPEQQAQSSSNQPPQTHETHTHELRREGKHVVLRRVRIDCGLAYH